MPEQVIDKDKLIEQARDPLNTQLIVAFPASILKALSILRSYYL